MPASGSAADQVCDIVVIGAGMAGMVAARDLAEAGCRVTLLEARERLGGRIWTMHPPDWPLPVELGAEFVHGSPKASMDLIRAAGAEVQALDGLHLVRTRDGFLPMDPFTSRMANVIGGIDSSGPDRSMADVLREQQVDSETALLIRMFVEGFDAAPPEEISAIAVKKEYSAGHGRQGRIVGGYDTVVSFLERELQLHGVPVHRRTRVREIRWKRECVEATAQSSCYRARAAVVALPLGVLNARPEEGGVSFLPEIESKRRFLTHIETGQVIRVVLRLREPVWERVGSSELSFVHAPELEFPTWWTALPDRVPQITGWCGAERASHLLRLEPADIADRALDALADIVEMTRSELDPLLIAYHHHPFGRDRYARGAYSFVRVGGLEAPTRLHDLEAETVAFAGEYTETDDPGTVAAAIASGRRSARALLSAIG